MSEHGVRSGEGRLTGLLSRVGDLGSPFYAEERQRDVWNEASAVGLQTALWCGLAAAAAMVWVGGATGLRYGLVVLAVVSVASWATYLHARAHGVDSVVAEGVRVLRWRMLPLLLLLAAFAAGALHATAASSGFGRGAAVGAGLGAAAGLGAVVVARLSAGRRSA